MNTFRINRFPSTATTGSVGSTATSTKSVMTKAGRQAEVHAAMVQRSERPGPSASRDIALKEIQAMSQRLGIDLPGRAVALRPATPVSSR